METLMINTVIAATCGRQFPVSSGDAYAAVLVRPRLVPTVIMLSAPEQRRRAL